MTAALSIEIGGITGEKLTARIYLAGDDKNIDWNSPCDCELGESFKTYSYRPGESGSHTQNAPVEIARGLDGSFILHLTETRRYSIRLVGEPGRIYSLPKLRNESNKLLRCERDENLLTFQFVNYLGRSHIIFPVGSDSFDLPIEVIPSKMDFEKDYIGMTEYIAEKCAELLMEYSGATSSIFSQSDTDPGTLTEQFIFLRQFCLDNSIGALFEAIKRNPDRRLVEEYEFKPYGAGMPSRKVFTQPFSYAKQWQRISDANGNYYAVPQTIAVLRKKDSLDTPANRFLKFALRNFDEICIRLIQQLQENRKNNISDQAECETEAVVIHTMIDDILRDHFFDDIGEMNIVPQNNQVLQKREGYSQIFHAYCMIDLALRLDWKGKDDIYEGESKNVALLYEYWLFFVLYSIFRDRLKCKAIRPAEGVDRFTDWKQGKLVISLREGKESCQCFLTPNGRTKINLYYNRVFKRGETMYEGSYSRPFRPDFTLAIFPAYYQGGRYNGEGSASEEGAVSFLHFDAKYRITDLTRLFGKDTDVVNDDEDEDAEIQEELDDEKSGEIINTYKRGDLLKMHTYNDAIRRTVGSYVLYPGTGRSADRPKRTPSVWSVYDEILPGVGAFAVKPSIEGKSEEEICCFIRDAIEENERKSSRISRLKYFNDMILREPSSSETAVDKKEIYFQPTESRQKLCLVGYLRKNYWEFLKSHGRMVPGQEFLFYYYAIRGEFVYSHHKDLDKTKYFRFYTNDLGRDGFYFTEPVAGEIVFKQLVPRSELVRQLRDLLGFPTEEKDHSADFYYLLRIRVSDDHANRMKIPANVMNAANGNDSFSPHSPKVIPFDDLDKPEFIVADDGAEEKTDGGYQN